MDFNAIFNLVSNALGTLIYVIKWAIQISIDYPLIGLLIASNLFIFNGHARRKSYY